MKNKKKEGQYEINVYDLNTQRQCAFKRLDKAGTSEDNKQLIKKFYERQQADNISLARRIKYIYTLSSLAEILGKPFKEATKEDIIKTASKIQNKDDLAEWTKHDYLIILKRFYKWLYGLEDEYPDIVKWLKPKKPKRKIQINPEEYFTQEDILAMHKAASTPRMKLMPLLFFELHARPSEAITLKNGSIEFDEDERTANIHLEQSKTTLRPIPIKFSVPALRDYLNVHVAKHDKDAPLFYNEQVYNEEGRVVSMDYDVCRNAFRKLIKKAGIKRKYMSLYSFRKGGICFKGNELGLTQSELEALAGWVPGGGTIGSYLGSDFKKTKSRYNELIGGGEPKPRDIKLKVKGCMWCGEENPPGMQYCKRCRRDLDTTLEERVNYELDRKIQQLTVEKIMSKPNLWKNIVEEVYQDLKKEGYNIP